MPPIRLRSWVIAAATAVTVGGLSPLTFAQQSAVGAAQAVQLPAAESTKAFIASRMQKNWTPPRTPWGDPDIQGNFTTKDEANTPMERPAEWAGRAMDSIAPKELAAAIVKRQQAAVESAPFAGGGEPDEGIAIAVPIHWFDNLAAVNSRPWFVIDPPDGVVPPVKPDAPSANARGGGQMGGRRDTYTDRSSGDRCISWGAWRLPTIYGNSYQIVQTPDYVVLRQEQVHEARMVPLKGSAPLDPAIRTHLGQARGHWEGNTLVVVTTNFHPDTTLRGFGRSAPGRRGAIPASNLRLIERFTRIAPGKVEWTMTFDDPKVYARDWTFSLPMTEDDKQIIHEYACHEGNFGLANILSAGRAAEAQAAPRRD